MSRSAKQQPTIPDQSEVPHLFEQESYSTISSKVDELKRKVLDLEQQRTALIEERRRLSSSEQPITFSSALIENQPEMICSLSERVSGLNDRIRALQKSIQLGESELERVRNRLSYQVTESCRDLYRMQARIVLCGMLDVQLGNTAIGLLRERLERNGYAAGRIVPVGIAPWPLWGHPVDPSSVWQRILREFLDAKFITTDELSTIISGELAAFRP